MKAHINGAPFSGDQRKAAKPLFVAKDLESFCRHSPHASTRDLSLSLFYAFHLANNHAGDMPLTWTTLCVMFSVVLPTRPTPIQTYARRKSEASSWISRGNVAEKLHSQAVCQNSSRNRKQKGRLQRGLTAAFAAPRRRTACRCHVYHVYHKFLGLMLKVYQPGVNSTFV